MDSVSVMPGARLGVEHGEQHPLGQVVRRGGIAGRRSDALVSLGDEVVVGQRLVGRVAPELAPDPLVQALREGLREAVGERLGHDRAVVVVGGLELAHQRIDPVARGDRERAHVIGHADRPHVVGHAQVRPPVRLRHLLAQPVDPGQLRSSGPRPPTGRCRRPAVALAGQKPDDRARLQQLLVHDPGQQPPRIVVQLARVRTHHGVGQDRRERALAAPRWRRTAPSRSGRRAPAAGSARRRARPGTTAAAASSTSPPPAGWLEPPRGTAASRGRPAPRAPAAPPRTPRARRR